MAGFAERMGAKPVRSVLQVDELDEDTRVAIWNLLYKSQEILQRNDRQFGTGTTRDVLKALYESHYRQPLDAFSGTATVSWMRRDVTSGTYIDCLGIVEAFAKAADASREASLANAVRDASNKLFSEYLVGFRFVDRELVAVSSDEEAESIEAALSATSGLEGAQQALQSALALLSDREHPNYAKSVAESIHAVEAIVRHLTGASTLGDGLKVFESKGLKLHKALRAAWSSMYGYASDEHGVRHGSIGDNDIDERLATYFLVTCSAFVNLLLKLDIDSGT